MISGRWDLIVHDTDGDYPSWVHLSAEGGWFVGKVGSARPVIQTDLDGDTVRWQLPKQYEGRSDDLVFSGELVDGRLEGTFVNDAGAEVRWEGTRAPELPKRDVTWGEPIELVRDSAANWSARWPHMEDNWAVTADGLVNSAAGTDYVSNELFTDFHLTAEYRYPEGSNSGIYLRGRYEFQVLDDHGTTPHVGGSAAIYGFIRPSNNAIHPHSEWNVAEITLVGRFITVVLNGETIIGGEEIPGITGGALDANEGEPGPILIQGDHGPVTYRRLTVRPAL